MQAISSRLEHAKFLENFGAEIEAEVATKSERLRAHRFQFWGSWGEFQRLFKLSAEYVMREKCEAREFIIDERNIYVIQQLYLYMSHNPKFNGDLNKGIALQGAIGCGKSLLMRSYDFLQNRLISKYGVINVSGMTFIHSAKLVTTLKKEEPEMWSRREIIIDELGREPKSTYDYGNQSRPLVELLCARAENRSFTHATTNFALETLVSSEYYGAMVGDRLRAMFNFIIVDGLSRRE